MRTSEVSGNDGGGRRDRERVGSSLGDERTRGGEREGKVGFELKEERREFCLEDE